MIYITDYYCRICGESLVDTTPINLNGHTPTPTNICTSNHLNTPNEIHKILWSSEIKLAVERLCTEEELKLFRLNAEIFIINTLNQRLKQRVNFTVKSSTKNHITTIEKNIY